MPKFNDATNMPPMLPDGDYIYQVAEFTCGIQNGGKTGGSDNFKIILHIEPTGNRVHETMIDHPSCNWKIDCFLKSAGIKLTKWEGYEFVQDKAEAAGVRWINPIGLRGWCHIGVETLPAKDNRPAREINKVSVFYTDKEKLAPLEIKEEDMPF